MNINWIILIIGGIFESLFALSLGKMQQTTGKELLWWFISFIIFVASSMLLLYKSMGGAHPIPTGTAYAVWAGIGAVGTVLLGIFIFKEPVTFWRIFFLSTLIISIIGLQITSSAAK
jgi:quaternary ammonium compound-resistance protein SugE